MPQKLRAFLRDHGLDLLTGLRVGVAAVLAYLAAVLLRLPEPQWTVMSAVIVGRGGPAGSGGTPVERIVGTLIGAGVGSVAALARTYGVPEVVLLFLALTPLAAAPSGNGAFRAAPIAALIVMSAAAAGHAGEGAKAAVLRLGDVGLGSLVALLVSRFLVPVDTRRQTARAAAALTTPLANLLSLSLRGEPEAREKHARLSLAVRRDLRDLTARVRRTQRPFHIGRRRRAHDDGADEKLAAALARVQASLAFIERALRAAPHDAKVAECLAPVSRALRARLAQVGERLSGGKPLAAAGVAGASELDTAIETTRAKLAAIAAAEPATHLEAMPFLLGSLSGDLAALAEAADGMAPKKRGGETAAAARAEAAPAPEPTP